MDTARRCCPFGLLLILLISASPAVAQVRPETAPLPRRAAAPQNVPAPPRIERPASSPRTPGSKTSAVPSRPSYWSTLGGLAAVLLLILGTAALARRHLPQPSAILPPEAVQVLGRRYLDHRQSIQIVRCGSRILILANSAQHGLHTLSEITDPVEVDLLAGLCQQAAPRSATQSFAQVLGWEQERPAPTARSRTEPPRGPLTA